jgi:hypothetical protein
MTTTFDEIVGGSAKLWKSLISNRRANIHLYLENFNLIALASFFTVISSIAGYVVDKGTGEH